MTDNANDRAARDCAMSGICAMCARRECTGRDDDRYQCDKYLSYESNYERLLRICDNCAYFGPQLDHGQEIECADDGACRKNPPMVLSMDDAGGFAAIFPPVNREDWCGCWEAGKR